MHAVKAATATPAHHTAMACCVSLEAEHGCPHFRLQAHPTVHRAAACCSSWRALSLLTDACSLLRHLSSC